MLGCHCMLGHTWSLLQWCYAISKKRICGASRSRSVTSIPYFKISAKLENVFKVLVLICNTQVLAIPANNGKFRERFTLSLPSGLPKELQLQGRRGQVTRWLVTLVCQSGWGRGGRLLCQVMVFPATEHWLLGNSQYCLVTYFQALKSSWTLDCEQLQSGVRVWRKEYEYGVYCRGWGSSAHLHCQHTQEHQGKPFHVEADLAFTSHPNAFP